MKKTFLIAALVAVGALSVAAGNHPQPQSSTKQAPAASAAAPQAAAAQTKIDPAKEANIRKLLELTGAKDLALQGMAQMEQAMRPMLTASFPPGEYRAKLIDLFLAKFHSKVDSKAIVDMAIPVYDKYFSDEEIKGLMEFYATPLGKKTLQNLPKLMGELQAQGQQWGQQIGRQAVEEVLTENPDLSKALEDAQKAKQP